MAYKHFKKTQGRDFNFYTIVQVNWTQFGASDGFTVEDGYGPDIIIRFSTQGFSLINYGATSSNSIEYSFNGTTVAGDMVPGTPTAALVFDYRTVDMIWFRLKAGSTGPVDVRVEAWSK